MIEPNVPALNEVDAVVQTTRPVRDDQFVTAAYAAHRTEIYSFLRRATHDPSAAEDLVQEAFIRLTREAKAGRQPDNLRAWLYQVSANLAVSRGRRAAVALRWLRGRASTDIDSAFNPPEASIIAHERVRSIERGLLRLAPAARTALLMAGQGFSGDEIAVAIGRSEGATRTLMSRGRVRLRSLLDVAEDER